MRRWRACAKGWWPTTTCSMPAGSSAPASPPTAVAPSTSLKRPARRPGGAVSKSSTSSTARASCRTTAGPSCPPDELRMTTPAPDIITPDEARTLAGLFRERVRRCPDAPAYRYFDETSLSWESVRWADMARQVARWQAALQSEGLERSDRVAVMLQNGREWVCFDQAALGLGLVVVPLYVNDRAENAAYILRASGVLLLLIGGAEHWETLREVRVYLCGLFCVVVVKAFDEMDPLLTALQTWLPADAEELRTVEALPEDLATIVYTSGTTGNPKGVMLSHRNILWNAHACLRIVPVYHHDLFLSFLPLSHTLERTVGHYVPMMAGAEVAHARSIAQLSEDLMKVRPTILVSVPRIFDRIYAKMRAPAHARSAANRCPPRARTGAAPAAVFHRAARASLRRCGRRCAAPRP